MRHRSGRTSDTGRRSRNSPSDFPIDAAWTRAAGLESAIATPQVTFGGEFLHRTIPAMAAAYLFHLCQDHAFIDGNKRVTAGAVMRPAGGVVCDVVGGFWAAGVCAKTDGADSAKTRTSAATGPANAGRRKRCRARERSAE